MQYGTYRYNCGTHIQYILIHARKRVHDTLYMYNTHNTLPHAINLYTFHKYTGRFTSFAIENTFHRKHMHTRRTWTHRKMCVVISICCISFNICAFVFACRIEWNRILRQCLYTIFLFFLLFSYICTQRLYMILVVVAGCE